jgi:hypothetical protein
MESTLVDSTPTLKDTVAMPVDAEVDNEVRSSPTPAIPVDNDEAVEEMEAATVVES